MSEKIKNTIFTSTDCLSEQTMFNYIDGKLGPKEQHVVEKHLLECEFCSDAIEGLQILKNRSRINTINSEINERISGSERKIFGINYTLVMSAAAAIILLIGGVFFFNHFVSGNLENKNVVSDLKLPEEKENKIRSFQIDSSAQESKPDISKNQVSSEKDEKPETKSLENTVESLSESEEVSDQENNSVTEVSVTDESVLMPSQPAASKEIIKDIPMTTSTNQSQTIAQDKSFSKNDYNNYDLKKTAEESKNVNTNEGYAEEQAVTRNIETTSALKTDSKKKEKQAKKEEAQKPSTGAVPYAPQPQMYADQTILMDSINIPEEPVYTKVDEKPEYPGGDPELIKYFQKNIDFSKWYFENENVIGFNIQFIVDSKGKASKAKLLKPYNIENEKKIIELVNNMPHWKPGKLNGKQVSVLINLPVKLEGK